MLVSCKLLLAALFTQVRPPQRRRSGRFLGSGMAERELAHEGAHHLVCSFGVLPNIVRFPATNLRQVAGAKSKRQDAESMETRL